MTNERERMLAEGPRIAPEAGTSSPSGAGSATSRRRVSTAASVRGWVSVRPLLEPFVPALVTFGPLLVLQAIFGLSGWVVWVLTALLVVHLLVLARRRARR